VRRREPEETTGVWETQYGDMILDDDTNEWVPSPYILELQENGWEPFSVTNMFAPNDEGGYKFSERIWFRRKRANA